MSSYEMTYGPKPASTKGSTSTAMTIPLSGALPGRRVGSVRPSVFIESSSGNVEVRFGYQTSNDNVTWSGTSPLSGYTSWVSAAGWTRGATFASPSPSPFVRVVLEARNTIGSDIECASVTVILELQFG